MTRGAKVEVKCQRCKQPFMARVADRARGWAKFCSKSCKAIEQEKKTGQYAAYKERDRESLMGEPEDRSWDGHKDSWQS